MLLSYEGCLGSGDGTAPLLLNIGAPTSRFGGQVLALTSECGSGLVHLYGGQIPILAADKTPAYTLWCDESPQCCIHAASHASKDKQEKAMVLKREAWGKPQLNKNAIFVL